MSHRKAFARKLRQLSNLRKKIVRTNSLGLRQKLLKRYQALLQFLLHRIAYRKLMRYLVIPGLFVMQEAMEAGAQNFLLPDSMLINNSAIGVARPVTADLDGDGDLDIYYVDSETEGMRFIENVSTDTDLQFADAAPSPLFPEGSFNYGSFSIGDMDDDGDLDVLFFVGSYDDGTQILFSTFENTGTIDSPEFIPGDQPIVLQGTGVMSPSLVDLDADGDLDILGTLARETYDREPNVSIVYYENQSGIYGPEQKQAPLNLKVEGNVMIGNLTVGDVDEDGDLDVLSFLQGLDGNEVIQEYFQVYNYHENTGTATEPLFADPVASPFGLFAPRISIEIIDFPHLADLDSDDDLDVLAYRYNLSNEVGQFLFIENSDSLMTSISDIDLPKLLTYPNPVKDLLHIESDFLIERVTLYSTSGRKIKEYTNLFGQTPQLPMHDLPSGSYFGIVKGEKKAARIHFAK